MAKELKTSKRSDLRRTADDLDGFMQKVSHGLSTYHLQHGLWFLACLSANSRYQRGWFVLWVESPFYGWKGRIKLLYGQTSSCNLECKFELSTYAALYYSNSNSCNILAIQIVVQSEFIYILVDGQVRTGGKVQNDDILAFAKLFNDELTLDNISRCTCAPPSVLGQGVLRAIRSHHNCSFPTLGGSINLSQFWISSLGLQFLTFCRVDYPTTLII